MRSIAILLVLAVAFLFGCQQKDTSAAHDDHSAHQPDMHSAENDGDATAGQVHNHEAVGLTLNQGKKWKMNEEMMPHVAAAEQVFSNYIAMSGTDHKTLAAKLKEHNEMLIKSCTMRGESHDQLHIWLVPHLDLVADLGEAGSEDDAVQIIKKLEASFAKFDAHFE